jgi:hypothetical protein
MITNTVSLLSIRTRSVFTPIREATAEAEHVATTEAAEREVAERAAHWATEIDKALAYRRDINWRKVVVVSILSTAFSGDGLCAARMLLSASRWQRTMMPAPSATATQPPCRRETAAAISLWRPLCSHDFPLRDGGGEAMACRIGFFVL